MEGPSSDYEHEQLEAIREWKAEQPGVVGRMVGVALAPVTWVAQKIIPDSAVEAAVDGASSLGSFLADTRDVRRAAGVQSVSELRAGDLEVCDRLANDVHNWAIGLAALEGTAAGAFGILSAPVDVPAIITLAMRTIHKIGVCYGFQCETEDDRRFVRGILAAAGANSMEEKLGALAALSALRGALLHQSWRLIAERAAQNQISKEAALLMLRNLAKQVGINLTKRRALAAIPAIGAAVGGSINAWYVKEVGWAARRSFQERWLEARESAGPEDEAA